ncbi:MAG: hypothetical protein AAFP09_01605 [Cyanobacteria bacterium J06607_10]
MGDIVDSSSRPSSRYGVTSSWLSTFQGLMGTRSHKPSFVLFDIGQSGCMTLSKWLAAHKQITFQPDILQQPVRFPRLNVYQHIRHCSTDVYGFSLTVEQLRQVQRVANPNQFLQDLHRGGCRVIYLNRRDALRHAIATLKTYSVNCRFDIPDTGARSNKLTVDVSELLACLKYLDNQRVEAKAILDEVPHLELVYEDDLMDPNMYAATAQHLSSFLDIPHIRPVGNSLKLVHQHLSDIVINYEEVIEGVENSEYAYLLTNSRHLLTV